MTITIEVTADLIVEVAGDHLAIDRQDGGRVRVEAAEIRALVAALAEAAGLLAESAALAVDDNPRCAGCGKELAESASPYWVDVGESVYLCDECADAPAREADNRR